MFPTLWNALDDGSGVHHCSYNFDWFPTLAYPECFANNTPILIVRSDLYFSFLADLSEAMKPLSHSLNSTMHIYYANYGKTI